MKVLSVQIPAPCLLDCVFCRTPDHNKGNPARVLRTVNAHLNNRPNGYKEVYLTSNGETGLSTIFGEMLEIARKNSLGVAVLCATEHSVVPGLCRVEVSLNPYTEPLAIKAIAKAKRLGIPTVISMVDTGTPINPDGVAKQYKVDGVLVRSLQVEGKSHKKTGSTRYFSRLRAKLGHFPVAAYRELLGLGFKTTCIDHEGNTVALLGLG